MSIRTRIDDSTDRVKSGKRALADALNMIGVSSSPNDNAPDIYESFQSYADKIKKCIPAPSLIFEIEITDDSTALNRAYVLPMTGLNYSTILESINSQDSTSPSQLKVSYIKEEKKGNSDSCKIVDIYGNEIVPENYVEEMECEDPNPPTGVPDWDNTKDYDEQMEFYNMLSQISPLATSDYDFTVDWGDGSSNTFNNLNDEACYHIYKSTGTYQIGITGTFKRMYRSSDTLNGYPTRNKTTKVISWGNTGLTSMSEAFRGETKLNSIPLLDTTNSFKDVSTFYCCFYGCTGLTEIPYDYLNEKGLFDGCSSCTTFSYCFCGCNGMIGTIPPGLFKGCSKSTNYSYVFNGCSKLTGGLPVGMFDGNEGITNVASAFKGDSRLTGTIDPNIFSSCPNITSYAEVFWDCSGLTGEVPAGLFVSSKATDFRNAMKNCKGLTSINKDAFLNTSSNGVKLTSVFEGCTKISEIPEGLFDGLTGSDLTLDRMFYGCTGIKTIPGSLFSKITNKVKSAGSIFGFCTGLTGLNSGDSIIYPTYNEKSQWEDPETIRIWFGCFGNTGSFDQLSKLPEDLGGTGSRVNSILPGDIVLSDKTVVKVSDYSHNQENPAIALIIDYDDSRSEGNKYKAMALTDTTKMWTPQSDIEDTPVENKSSYDLSVWNGRENTDLVLDWGNYTEEKYPAHTYVNTYITTGTNKGDWYLGSIPETWYPFVRKGLLEKAVQKIKEKYPSSNVTNYRDNTYYWSSSENSARVSWYSYTYYSGVHTYYKWNSFYVRPCLSF